MCDAAKLKKRIAAFDINGVGIDEAQECKQRLDRINIDDVKTTSQVAATFYYWVRFSINDRLYVIPTSISMRAECVYNDDERS